MLGLGVAGSIFLSLATSCFVLSGFFIWQEIGEVNRKLPEDEQISYYWTSPTKMSRIKTEYKRLYPSGRVELLRVTFQIAGFVFLVLAALTSGLVG